MCGTWKWGCVRMRVSSAAVLERCVKGSRSLRISCRSSTLFSLTGDRRSSFRLASCSWHTSIQPHNNLISMSLYGDAHTNSFDHEWSSLCNFKFVCICVCSHHRALHDAFEVDEVQVIGRGGAVGTVTHCVQNLGHYNTHNHTHTNRTGVSKMRQWSAKACLAIWQCFFFYAATVLFSPSQTYSVNIDTGFNYYLQAKQSLLCPQDSIPYAEQLIF